MHLSLNTWGGKRKGAGRHATGYRSSELHAPRKRFDRLTAAHVTLRLVDDIKTLRTPDAFFALRKATKSVLGRADFRIVHLSPEDDHLHLLSEANNDEAISKGIQAFEISAAQHLNRALSKHLPSRRKGSVFADRYHTRFVTSPTQARNTIVYVLNNWRHHDQDELPDTRDWDVDYFSSAVSFDGWEELETRPFLYTIPEDRRLCVSQPQTWLLRQGWRKAGLISMNKVPGETARKRVRKR